MYIFNAYICDIVEALRFFFYFIQIWRLFSQLNSSFICLFLSPRETKVLKRVRCLTRSICVLVGDIPRLVINILFISSYVYRMFIDINIPFISIAPNKTSPCDYIWCFMEDSQSRPVFDPALNTRLPCQRTPVFVHKATS